MIDYRGLSGPFSRPAGQVVRPGTHQDPADRRYGGGGDRPPRYGLNRTRIYLHPLFVVNAFLVTLVSAGG